MDEKKYKKVLIIREGAIGDVVHTSNIFRSLKNFNPDVLIDYVTSKVPAQLLLHDSRLNRVIILEGKDYKSLTRLGLELRKEKYDLVINLQPSLRFKYLSTLLNAKDKVIYKKAFKMHAVENFFDTAKKKIKSLQNINDLTLQMPESVVEKVKSSIPSDKKIVVLNTQTSVTRQGRKWPFESFKALALSLIETYDCNVIVTGSKDDIEAVEEYKGLHPNIHVVAGQFNILESAAVFSLADVVVSGDTGPLHIASAFEKPYCIGLYGAASVGRTGPWGMNHFAVCADLPCIPCDKRKCKFLKDGSSPVEPCMTAIKPEHVFRIITDNDLL